MTILVADKLAVLKSVSVVYHITDDLLWCLPAGSGGLKSELSEDSPNRGRHITAFSLVQTFKSADEILSRSDRLVHLYLTLAFDLRSKRSFQRLVPVVTPLIEDRINILSVLSFDEFLAKFLESRGFVACADLDNAAVAKSISKGLDRLASSNRCRADEQLDIRQGRVGLYFRNAQFVTRQVFAISSLNDCTHHSASLTSDRLDLGRTPALKRHHILTRGNADLVDEHRLAVGLHRAELVETEIREREVRATGEHPVGRVGRAVFGDPAKTLLAGLKAEDGTQGITHRSATLGIHRVKHLGRHRVYLTGRTVGLARGR